MTKYLVVCLVCVLSLLAGPSYSQTPPVSTPEWAVQPSIGTSVTGAIHMQTSTPAFGVQGAVLVHYGILRTQHTILFETVDVTTAGHDRSALTYDGYVLLEPKRGGLAFGAGLRVTVTDNILETAHQETILRPSIVLGKRIADSFTTVALLFPGTDGWRAQYGLLGQSEIFLTNVHEHALNLCLTAGGFSYYETAPKQVPVYQSYGKVVYETMYGPRTLGGVLGVGLKYYF